ncbi:MAG: flavodoxin [Pseudomonadota bacterium]|nr:flavodoxin [Pseudomonadota bacterium]
MSNRKIGIFFGTETGTTRLIAKKIHKLLGAEQADKPVNVNRIQAADLLQYDALILGTPSYGVGDIPGLSAGCLERNWEEFLAQFGQPDLAGKRIAFFGLGAQERYADRFASSLMALYTIFKDLGADMVGDWSTDGYTFEHSASVVEGRFVGLVIDQRTQGMHTEERLRSWVEQVKPLLLEKLTPSQAAGNLQGATA